MENDKDVDKSRSNENVNPNNDDSSNVTIHQNQAKCPMYTTSQQVQPENFNKLFSSAGSTVLEITKDNENLDGLGDDICNGETKTVINIPPSATRYANSDAGKESGSLESQTSKEDFVDTLEKDEDEKRPSDDKNDASDILFDEAEIYAILDIYKMRVHTDLLEKEPTLDVLNLAQKVGVGVSHAVYRSKDGIPLPLPYDWIMQTSEDSTVS